MTDKVPTRQHVREFARSCVRSGLLDAQDLHDEVALAVRTELPDEPDADGVAGTWVAEFRDELLAEQAGWPAVTDYHRLQDAFAELERSGVRVLQGCEDHWAAKAVCEREDPRGVAWFTPPDVWHAIDEGMLEVNLWHGSTANAAPGDELLAEAIAVLARHGLSGHFDEGRIEVGAAWRRPLAG